MRLYVCKATMPDGDVYAPITVRAATRVEAEAAIRSSGLVENEDELDTKHIDDVHLPHFGRSADDDGSVRIHHDIAWNGKGPLEPVVIFGTTPTTD